nr:cupin domain-containing protein [Maliibacterium massiliense]
MYIPIDKLVDEPREHMRGGKGTVTVSHIIPKGKHMPPNCRLFARITVPAGASIGLHEHVDETEIFHCIAGEVIVSDGGQHIRLTPGDSVSTGGGASHSVENISGQDAVLLATIIMG